MELLAGWKERLENRTRVQPAAIYTCPLPKSPDFYAARLTHVTTAEEAQALVELAQQRPLSYIGVDTEFCYDRPGIRVKTRQTVHDPRSIHPLLLSLALVESTSDSEGQVYPFVVDLRKIELMPYLKSLLQFPLCFVGHFLKVEWFCLWQLGLPEPRIVWDTWVHEKAQSLGLNHKRYKLPPSPDDADEAQAKEEGRQMDQFSNSLVATCHRYGVPYAMAGDKARLQSSFLAHPDHSPFSKEQIRYAAEDAIAAANLYPHQVQQSLHKGSLYHLETVEMPWVTTNARMEWNGVRVNPNAREQALASSGRYRPRLEEQLKEYGVGNARSHKQLQQFFEKEGLLALFKQNGNYSFDKKQLKRFMDRHPAIPLIRAIRRIDDLCADPIFSPELVGQDGRMHPEYRQLGTHTGRQTSQHPNILGLDRALRPVIIPEDGYGIGEIDWAQIEVGIAAAVYQDEQLTEMFNTGDVYSAMAQQYYRDQLSPEDQTLSGAEFKKTHPQFRDQMKTCTLGVIYGMTAQGLANELNTSVSHAAAFQSQFLTMFPTLKHALFDTMQFGALRGYAHTHTGLRRYRAGKGPPTSWERNWLKNHPVQGSAAVLFKVAGNRLDKLYQRYQARLIIPLHDSFVFEAPLEVLKEVADLTARIMCETVQEQFPELCPRVEINMSHPECWSKDGDAEAFERWLENPLP